MMNDVRALSAVQPGNLDHRPAGPDGAVAAAAPAKWPQREAFTLDRFAMVAHPRRHDDLEPGIARRSGDRQPV